MKKVFAIVAFVAAMFVAGNAQAQLSVNIGYAPESIKTVIDNSVSTENYQGFFAGVTYNIGLAKDLGVAIGPQLRLNTNSETSSLYIPFVGTITGTSKSTQLLIDVPVLFNYGISINRDFTVTPFIGPMLTLAATGKTKVTTNNTTNTYNWYGDNSSYSRFNLNGVGGVALAYNQFKLFGGYRLGLLDLDSRNDYNVKTQGFFVGLGISF